MFAFMERAGIRPQVGRTIGLDEVQGAHEALKAQGATGRTVIKFGGW